MPLTPKNRKEEWLEGLVEHETTLTPKNRCEAWMKEIIDASGSGGGGGGGGAFYFSVTTQDGVTYETSKTPAEIKAAYDAGNVVICIDEVNYCGCGVCFYDGNDLHAGGMNVMSDGTWLAFSISIENGTVYYYSPSNE